MTDAPERKRRAVYDRQPREPIWTATRCNRLLRPLSAKVAAFRKSLHMDQPFEPILNEALEMTKFNVRQKSSLDEDANQDENWTLRTAGSRVRRTYRTRSRTYQTSPFKAHSESVHAEIALPTPLLQRAGSKLPEIIPTPVNDRKWDGVAGPIRRRGLKSNTQIETLCRVFDTFLQTTCEGSRVDESPGKSHQRRVGTSSLADTCLRRMSEHIADEASYRKLLDSEDNTDVSAETYSMLEEFDSMTASAHSAVRQAVRSEAIQMICTLVEDQNVTSQMAYALLVVCTQQRAYDEAESILRHFITSRPSPDLPFGPEENFDQDPVSFMGLLQEFGEVTGRQGFAFRTVRELIVTQKLPIPWLGSAAFRALWNDAMRSIGSSDSQHTDALILVQTTFEVAAGVYTSVSDEGSVDMHATQVSQWFSNDASNRRTSTRNNEVDDVFSALNKTVSSLCTLICALAYLKVDGGDSATSVHQSLPALRPLRLAALAIRRHYSSDEFVHQNREIGVAVPAAIIVLADLLVAPPATTGSLGAPWSRVLTLTRLCQLAQSSETYSREISDVLPDLLVSISSCCGRASDMIEDDAFNFFLTHMQRHNKLEKRQSYGASTIEDICSISYRKFWGVHDDAQMPQWPSTSPAKDGSRASRPSTTGPRDASSSMRPPSAINLAKRTQGFRWEEGFCDWIAMTPNIQIRSSPRVMLSSPCKRLQPRIPATMSQSSPSSAFSASKSSSPSSSSSPPPLSTAESDLAMDTTQLTEPSPVVQRVQTSHRKFQDIMPSESDDEDELSLVTPLRSGTRPRVECSVVIPVHRGALPGTSNKRRLREPVKAVKRVKTIH